MSWHGIDGHDRIVESFRNCLTSERMASTFLFVGPEGIGKATYARQLAQCLLCPARQDALVDACGQCPSCLQVQAETHPDLKIIRRPDDRSFLPIELLVGRKEHRMREGLCHDLALKPLPGSRKIAIIEDADYLNREGANCLLKTLEEPPPRSIIILIGTSEQRQLPTIRSRAQIIRFGALPKPLVAELLVGKSIVEDAQRARQLAQLSDGSLARACELCDVQFWEFREQLLEHLSRASWGSVALISEITQFVDSLGKDTASRRRGLHQVIRWSIQFYRQLLRASSGLEISGDDHLLRAVSQAQSWLQIEPCHAAEIIDSCMNAATSVDANANPSTLIAAWIDRLAASLLHQASHVRA